MRRTGKLSAAALDQALKSTGSFLVQVEANRLRDVTLTLHKDRMLQGHRCVCLSVGSTRLYPGKQQPDPQPVQSWDSSSGYVITQWGHLDRIISKSVQSPIRQPLVHTNGRYTSGGEPAGYVLFTSKWGVSNRHCFTRTMQTRAASTKKSDAGDEQTADNNKAVIKTIQPECLTPVSTQV